MRVVIVRESDVFVAQCIEYNISAHGGTIEDARSEFIDALIRHVLVHEQLGLDPFAEKRPATTTAHALWDCAVRGGATVNQIRVPGFRTSPKDGGEQFEADEIEELVASAA